MSSGGKDGSPAAGKPDDSGKSGASSGSATPRGGSKPLTLEELQAFNAKLQGQIVYLTGRRDLYKNKSDTSEQVNEVLKAKLEDTDNELARVRQDLDTITNQVLDGDFDNQNMAGTEKAGKVPVFMGDTSDNYSPTLWLGNIDQLAVANKWNADQKLSNTLLSLHGDAGVWRESESRVDPDCFKDWEIFKQNFLERFKPTRTAVESVRLIANLQQKQGEGVRTFFDRVNNSVYVSSNEALVNAKSSWADAGDQFKREDIGFKECQVHFVRVLFVNGLRPAIRTLMESRFSSLTSRRELLEAAIEAEVASTSEQRRIMELEAEVAAIRASANSHRGGGATRYAQHVPAGRGRGGANPGGNPGSGPSSSSSDGQNHRQRVAMRNNWIHCHKCRQWGKHLAKECKLSANKIAKLTDQDPSRPPSGPPKDPWWDQSLLTVDSAAQDPASKN